MMTDKITLFWFRRDLRLSDNAGLYYALKNKSRVCPIFIFDAEILKDLSADDKRVLFIHRAIRDLKNQMLEMGSDLKVYFGKPLEIFKQIALKIKIEAIYLNHDYEPSAIQRDLQIEKWAFQSGVEFKSYKDQCVFEKSEILTDGKKPYTVFTPYKSKWLSQVNKFYLKPYPTLKYQKNFLKIKNKSELISLVELGFLEDNNFKFPKRSIALSVLKNYEKDRNFPFLENGTSKMGLHLRFGTVSIRGLARLGVIHSPVWLSELIWRDFFIQVLWHFPNVENESFRTVYEKVKWRNSPMEFKKWSEGQTGYPLVDAGMRELNQTGHMHNRVRMVVASFLTKHLLMHWKTGERYFAQKLLDYDLSANNGNWQWAAGTGCDAAPYFRIFNPDSQQAKFDPEFKYIKKWVPEFGTPKYATAMVNHKFARERALEAFKAALKNEDV